MAIKAILLPGGVMPADLAYGALIEALGDDVAAIAKDLELYAGAAPPAGYTLDHEIAGVLRTAADAGFERFHLVGYSGGGAASVAFAAEHPAAPAEPRAARARVDGHGRSSDRRNRRSGARPIGWPSSRHDEMMRAFIAFQLAPGVEPPQPPPGPPPPWMANRPAGLRAFIAALESSTARCRSPAATSTQPVYFALGGQEQSELLRANGRARRDDLPRLHARGLRRPPPLRSAAQDRAGTTGRLATRALGSRAG